MFYTYVHRKADTGEVFYVGKGKGRRMRQGWTPSGHRSEFWRRTVEKHGFIPEVVAYWSDETSAFEHERLLIACFRDMGFQLCNLSDGGCGASGAKRSPAIRELIGSRYRGKTLSEEHRAKLAAAKRGTKQSPVTIAKRVSKFRRSAVRCIEAAIEFETIAAAVRWLRQCQGRPNASSSNVCDQLAGVKKRAYGFTWERIRQSTLRVNTGAGI